MAPAKTHPFAFSCVAVAVASFVGVAFAGCDTDAVGVESCRTIEAARCDLAPRCAKSASWAKEVRTEDEVTNCKTFYRDHCLNGIENAKGDPSTDATDACVKAMNAVGACASQGVADLATCGVAASDPTLAPCAALGKIEVLDACAFVAAPPSTTSSSSSDSTSATSDTSATTDTTTASTSGSSSSSGGGGGS